MLKETELKIKALKKEVDNFQRLIDLEEERTDLRFKIQERYIDEREKIEKEIEILQDGTNWSDILLSTWNESQTKYELKIVTKSLALAKKETITELEYKTFRVNLNKLKKSIYYLERNLDRTLP